MAIVYVPVAAGLLGRVFDWPVNVSLGAMTRIVAFTLVPLVAGMCIRRLAPRIAHKAARALSTLATLLLVAACVPVLVAHRHQIVGLVGDFTLVAIVVFVLVGLAVGHWLGGPDVDESTVLALSTATRHPAVAMAIAQDAAHRPTLLAAVLLLLVVGAIVSVPYVRWRRRAHRESGSQRRSKAS